MLIVTHDAAFLRQLKSYKKKHYNLSVFYEIVDMLAKGESLPKKNRDHALSGNWAFYRECHIMSDWILVYYATETELILVATGSHDDLFK